jgi:glycosyltransferase involved in cell wall biosynthesis
VVTTDAGGMREAVRDGVDGYVVPVRDVAALADRLVTLTRNGQLRARMGAAARARAVAEFSIERQIREFTRMYEAVTLRQAEGGAA